MRRTFLLTLLLTISSIAIQAQLWDQLARTNYRLDTLQTKKLYIEADLLSFFHDNEYSSKLTRGYTLPGLWVQPKLTYNPIKQMRLELGVHALIFNGANRYPNYVYHDIATWKGNQYQKGAHVLPWIKAQAEFKHLDIVLGNIYGGENHGLITPLWNAETNLSQDPETGFQLLWNRSRIHMDTWINWQSYIFKEDHHQEAFTVGSAWNIQLTRPNNRNFRLSMPVQLLVHHRGGEQDTTDARVKTLSNLACGIHADWNLYEKFFDKVSAEAHLVGCYQQAGDLWPFQRGYAVHTAVSTLIKENVFIKMGYLYSPQNFVSLYGKPFFNCLSNRDNTLYSDIHAPYLQIDYSKTFARHYTVGTQVEAFLNSFRLQSSRFHEFNFSFGIYLRICPSILIKSFS